MKSLKEQVSEKCELVATLEDRIRQMQTAEDDSYRQIQQLEAMCQQNMDIANTRLNEYVFMTRIIYIIIITYKRTDIKIICRFVLCLSRIRQLEEELNVAKASNVEIETSLKAALKDVAMAGERQRALEQESSQIKLLHLATTAELEQVKGALEKAHEDTSEIDALR